jgi:hypothetical protein
MYAWSSRDRLCPMRMTWMEHNYNEPEYEIVKYHKRRLRRWTKLDYAREGKIESHKFRIQRFAGRLGEWPLWIPHKFTRKKKVA